MCIRDSTTVPTLPLTIFILIRSSLTLQGGVRAEKYPIASTVHVKYVTAATFTLSVNSDLPPAVQNGGPATPTEQSGFRARQGSGWNKGSLDFLLSGLSALFLVRCGRPRGLCPQCQF